MLLLQNLAKKGFIRPSTNIESLPHLKAAELKSIASELGLKTSGRKIVADVVIEHIGKDVGIDESRIDEMAHHVTENKGLENAWAPLLEKDIAEIFRASL